MKNAIKPLVLMPKGCIEDRIVRRMEKAGYLVVVADDVSRVRIVTPPPLVPLDSLANIALEVLADEKVLTYDIRDTFRKRVLRAAMDQTPKPAASGATR